MKLTICLALAALVALTGCDHPDKAAELKAELKAEVDQVYKQSAEAAKTKVSGVGDIANGQLLAQQCVSCHGLDGVAAHSGAPFIAGLDQDYMVSALLGYLDESRKNSAMKTAASKLKPEQIADVSAYYASLKTPWKGENVGAAKPKLSLDQASIAAGAELAGVCNSCHGPGGNMHKDTIIPSLAAMPPEYFIPAMNSYFSGKRKYDSMQMFSYSLNPRKIEQLAAYYAAQIPRKPAPPQQGDAGAGEHVAAECAGCHSLDGNALNPAIPSLAGQPAEYIVKALKDYRSGARRDPMMTAAVRGHSDKQILDVSAYYSLQKPESALKNRMSNLKTFDPVAQGKQISAACDGCHGQNGNSTKPGIPNLTGLGIKYFFAATAAYRDGTRKHAVMQQMVGHLSDSDIEKAGFYYGTQLPVNHKKASGHDQAAGEKLGADCVTCHGAGGISTDPRTPSLAGQDAGYLAAAIRAYARKERSSDAMSSPAQALKEADIANVAGYFASLPASKPDTVLPAQPNFSIVVKCNRCHGEEGNSSEHGIPSLAGQSEAYLALALKEYQDGRRKNKYMNAMSDVLSLVEIKAIAAYYAKQEQKHATLPDTGPDLAAPAK